MFVIMKFSTYVIIRIEILMMAIMILIILLHFYISSDWVYASGGLWCEVFDKLGNTNWQTQLNNQQTEKPVTLYDLIKETIV